MGTTIDLYTDARKEDIFFPYRIKRYVWIYTYLVTTLLKKNISYHKHQQNKISEIWTVYTHACVHFFNVQCLQLLQRTDLYILKLTLNLLYASMSRSQSQHLSDKSSQTHRLWLVGGGNCHVKWACFCQLWSSITRKECFPHFPEVFTM